MPIKFRCPHCEQFLGISRSQAGVVTDCPMCGRTIRVPQLDGTVAPLPKAELNHDDAGLARALDALAALGNDGAAVVIEEGPRHAPPEAIALAPALKVEAVSLPPPSANRAHQVQSVGSPRLVAPPPHPSADAVPAGDPLQELANLEPKYTRRGSGRFSQRQLLLTGAVTGLLGMGCGFLVGRMSGGIGTPPSPPVATENPPVDPAPAEPVGTPVVEAQPGELQLAIEGRLSYINATGESRPDSGARVLAIPVRRTGMAKLPVMSFRSGASEVDLRVAQASIRALGGDFVVAGADGHYEIRLPATGRYHLLIVSKYQARDPEKSNEAAQLAVLKDWFDQPRPFFGQTQSMMVEVQFDGQRSSVRDHVFPKADR